MKINRILLLALVCAMACKGDDKPEPDPPVTPPGGGSNPGTLYPQITIDGYQMPGDARGGRILDFSRTGYRWGDEEIPTVAVKVTLNPPAGGADATALIQNAIDQVGTMPVAGRNRGAVLLKAGLYNVSGQLNLNKSGVVLRGEGSDPATGTRIVGTGVRSVNIDARTQNLVTVGGSGARTGTKPTTFNIKDDYVPEGRFWLRVTNASDFRVKDDVVVYREVNNAWIAALGLEGIWNTSDVNRMYAERVVTKIWGDTLWLENPIACSIDPLYGGGCVYKYTYSNRVNECGIENLALESEFFASTNEQHCWSGVAFTVAEHCWMRNVRGRYFGFGLADIQQYAKNITVRDCVCTDFQSTLGGSRRYAFLHTGQLSMVMDCTTDSPRHAFATSGSTSIGPNVFLRCSATRCYADVGPHRCWGQGTLYDNLTIDGAINLRNRYNNGGDRHGWAGVNEVAWNCSTTRPTLDPGNYPREGFIVQSPQVSGRNYAIGCIGTLNVNDFDIGSTPPSGDGAFIPARSTAGFFTSHVSPVSLYEAQLALRKTNQPGGVFDVK
ncbi:hypothetical protein FACS1894159_03780 [Bacteroidia bacterium]|nr:hypothetical protein FACS1894159_03780 [Bacteroidia bacterium]